MSWTTYGAIFFILWWLTFFAVLPIGLHTQDDDKDVVLGTVSSEPSGPHVLRAAFRATVVALVIFGLFYTATGFLGLGLDDIPKIIPED